MIYSNRYGSVCHEPPQATLKREQIRLFTIGSVPFRLPHPRKWLPPACATGASGAREAVFSKIVFADFASAGYKDER